MTFSRGGSTGMEMLAFQAERSGGCPLCGGLGAVPDPDRPVRLRPCPRCTPPRRRAAGFPKRLPEITAGQLVWNVLVCSFYFAAALLALVLPAAVWQLFTG